VKPSGDAVLKVRLKDSERPMKG